MTLAMAGISPATPKTILVAEDNEPSREMLRVFLEVNGYQVIEAENGREAVDIAGRANPDLILLDLNMPEIDGLSAARQIRDLEKLRHVPIIANSASGTYGIGLFQDIETLGSGYVEYLPKPIDFDNLIYLIDSLLQPGGDDN